MSKTTKELKRGPAPYSLSIKGASEYFGVTKEDLYKWMYSGPLRRGVHYLNIGRKPLIIREAFAEFLKEEKEKDEEKVFSVAQVAEIIPVYERTVRGWLKEDEAGRAVIPPDGWFRLPNSRHIRIKEWVVEKLKAGDL